MVTTALLVKPLRSCRETDMKNECVCSFCGMELPTVRFRVRHEQRCLVKLRRLGKPETAYQQFMRMVRGERQVQR